MTLKLKPKEEDRITFEQWAQAKYNEIVRDIDLTDQSGNIDPIRLNKLLIQFPQNFAWAVTVQEVELNKLNVLIHEYDQWYHGRYSDAHRTLREEAGGQGRAPTQAIIESRIHTVYANEIDVFKRGIEEQRSRVELLRSFVKVLEKQASVLQTLSSNMRSELFYSPGVTVNGTVSEARKNSVAKTVLRNAMRGNHTAQDS